MFYESGGILLCEHGHLKIENGVFICPPPNTISSGHFNHALILIKINNIDLRKAFDNSIINLFKFLRKLKIISNYYSVSINKNIPVFGGLGGGTGNAASILKVLLKGKISKSLLNKAESIIGTDLRLFFFKQGFLSNLKNITYFRKKKLFFILVKPNIRCSTKEIYSKVRKYSKKQLLFQNKINTKNKFINVISQENNDLQSIVEKKYPIIKKLLIAIRDEKGCCFSRMTGSGSVCYGLFKDQITAKKALNKLKIKFPKFWFSFAKTV